MKSGTTPGSCVILYEGSLLCNDCVRNTDDINNLQRSLKKVKREIINGKVDKAF